MPAAPRVSKIKTRRTPVTRSDTEAGIQNYTPSQKLLEFIRVSAHSKKAEASSREAHLRYIEASSSHESQPQYIEDGDSNSENTGATIPEKNSYNLLRKLWISKNSSVIKDHSKREDHSIYNINITSARSMGAPSTSTESEHENIDPGIQDKPRTKRTPVPRSKVRHAPRTHQEAPQSEFDSQQARTAPRVLRASQRGSGGPEGASTEASQEALSKVPGGGLSGLRRGGERSSQSQCHNQRADSSSRGSSADHERSDSGCGLGPSSDGSDSPKVQIAACDSAVSEPSSSTAGQVRGTCEATQGSSQARRNLVGAARGAQENRRAKGNLSGRGDESLGMGFTLESGASAAAGHQIQHESPQRGRSGVGPVRDGQAGDRGRHRAGGPADGVLYQSGDHQDRQHNRTQRRRHPASDLQSPSSRAGCESPSGAVAQEQRQNTTAQAVASEPELPGQEGSGAGGANLPRAHEPVSRKPYVSKHHPRSGSSGAEGSAQIQSSGASSKHPRRDSGTRSTRARKDQRDSAVGKGPNTDQHSGQGAERKPSSRSRGQSQSRGARGGAKGSKATHRTQAELLEAAKKLAARRARGEVVSVPESEDEQKVREVAYAYEEVLATYHHNPSLKFIKGPTVEAGTAYQNLREVAKIADQCGADYASYIQAQFYWFDKWFKRAPRTWELVSKAKFPALERYLEYIKIKSSQSVPAKVQSVSISGRARIDTEQLDKINETRLIELQLNWNIDEEEAFLRFARPGVGYFDAVWLRKHPTYKRLRQEKKL